VPLTFARNWYPAARFADLPEVLERTGGITKAMAEFGVNDYLRKWSRIGSVLPEPEVARRLNINRQQPVLWSKTSMSICKARRSNTASRTSPPIACNCWWSTTYERRAMGLRGSFCRVLRALA
jgi:Transcriptional regulators